MKSQDLRYSDGTILKPGSDAFALAQKILEAKSKDRPALQKQLDDHMAQLEKNRVKLEGDRSAVKGVNDV